MLIYFLTFTLPKFLKEQHYTNAGICQQNLEKRTKKEREIESA